jgi:hypothetical protein
MEQWLPKLTLILTEFLESTVSVVYYFSWLPLVQIFPIFELLMALVELIEFIAKYNNCQNI